MFRLSFSLLAYEGIMPKNRGFCNRDPFPHIPPLLYFRFCNDNGQHRLFHPE